MAVSSFTAPSIAAHSRNAFTACGASARVGAAPLTSVSSKSLLPEHGRFVLRSKATTSMAELSRLQSRGMLLKFFGCAGLLAAALGRAVRAQEPKHACCPKGACSFAIASIKLSTPTASAGTEASSFSHSSSVVPLVPCPTTSVLAIMGTEIEHTLPQLVAFRMVASSVSQKRRCPQAARNIGRQRRKPSYVGITLSAASIMGSSRTTRRRVGATLFAHSLANTVAAAAMPYDPSRVRIHIQVGCRESKTPAVSKGSMTSTRSTLHVQLCRRLLGSIGVNNNNSNLLSTKAGSSFL